MNIDRGNDMNGKKSSRWWVLYHLWVGVCFKIYVDASGITKVFWGEPSGLGPASAHSYAGNSAMVAIGSVIVGYMVSSYLIDIINKSPAKNKIKVAIKIVLPIAFLAGALIFAMATRSLILKSIKSPEMGIENSINGNKKKDIVSVFTTIQEANGITEKDLDDVALKTLESWIVSEIIKKGEERYANKGLNPSDFHPEILAKSVYMVVDGKKLAIVKVDVGKLARSVTIMGIKRGNFYRVACIKRGDGYIPVLHGECGKRVQEVFEVNIDIK